MTWCERGIPICPDLMKFNCVRYYLWVPRGRCSGICSQWNWLLSSTERDKPMYVHCAFKGKSPYIVVVGLHRGESNKNADDDELEWTDEKGNLL